MADNANNEVDLYKTEGGNDFQQTRYITYAGKEKNDNQRSIL